MLLLHGLQEVPLRIETDPNIQYLANRGNGFTHVPNEDPEMR